MSAKRNERTIQMMENFMGLHEQGLSIPEIAKRYSLSNDTVYRNLKEIADKNGVPREELLQVVKTPISQSFWERDRTQAKVSFETLKSGFKTLDETIDIMRQTIKEGFENENDN
ncbi:MAG: helix-turn-helix domain-containing protein [Clostridia bacterium]